MTSNHEEYSNGMTLKNSKCSVQIYWGSIYLCRKSNIKQQFSVANNLLRSRNYCKKYLIYKKWGPSFT